MIWVASQLVAHLLVTKRLIFEEIHRFTIQKKGGRENKRFSNFSTIVSRVGFRLCHHHFIIFLIRSDYIRSKILG
jgi:hypothetical protein